MATEPNDVRLQTLMKLQEELDMEAALEEQMLNLFRCFLERVRLRRKAHSSRHAKRMKMMAARHELHRNMAEKEEVIRKSRDLLEESSRLLQMISIDVFCSESHYDGDEEYARAPRYLYTHTLQTLILRRLWLRIQEEESFVFINVLNLDRLIENLKTIWIGRFHLSANPARFERPKASTFQKEKPVPSDDSCLVNRDLTNCVMGEVLQFSSINNLQVLLSNEGFHNTRVVYLGGLWVMIELKSSKSKSKFMEHVGVASWFRRLCNAQSDFAAKERIVWVDIEGVPLNAWTRSTFQKISSKWGELVELEDGYDDLFARKRICIKTSQTENILESFKLIVKGKVFWARAKELFVWSPSFKDVPEKELFSDDESAKINEQANNLNNDEVENASEVVSDTYFGDNGEVQGFEQQHGESNDKEVSSDPFNIYNLLDKRTKEVRTTDTSTSIPYPPGFTPANDIPACNNQDIPEAESDRPPSRSARSNSRVLEEAENSVDRVSSESFSNGVKIKEGGSILEILEEMITVGQTMGFSMEGCTKDMEKIIGTQGEQLVFR
ncbi:hypothetical protein Tco_0624172 [Tanacetum coccineum]|uniref:DUF4283 domain-containing protein n=1 Tax=Tanacetum coccineum TaxID=301880 RepID=A0ABQ4WD61_9ASTR